MRESSWSCWIPFKQALFWVEILTSVYFHLSHAQMLSSCWRQHSQYKFFYLISVWFLFQFNYHHFWQHVTLYSCCQFQLNIIVYLLSFRPISASGVILPIIPHAEFLLLLSFFFHIFHTWLVFLNTAKWYYYTLSFLSLFQNTVSLPALPVI